MSKEELHNDMLYHAAISMAKSMLEKGLITEEEYAEIDTILLEKYRPYLGTLLSENQFQLFLIPMDNYCPYIFVVRIIID